VWYFYRNSLHIIILFRETQPVIAEYAQCVGIIIIMTQSGKSKESKSSKNNLARFNESNLASLKVISIFSLTFIFNFDFLFKPVNN